MARLKAGGKLNEVARYSYTLVDDELKIYMPHLSMKISYGDRSKEICGLVDTGAEISIMPYRVGCDLGAVWDELPETSAVVGPTGRHEARLLTVKATIPGIVDDHDPIELLFCWSKDESDMIIFGQFNFFLHFDACFYRSYGVFDVLHRQSVPPDECR